ncbi:TPA: hypothetical protein ACP32N_003156 [Pseudomonas aeruginosa]
MSPETSPNLDPYETRPFKGYLNEAGDQVETYLSLMHFIEAEKFRGIDEGYRRYLLSIEDRDDFLLETAGITQGVRRSDWERIKAPMVRAGLWMQLVQNQDSMVPLIMHPGCTCELALVDMAIKVIALRLQSEDPLRKVLLVGATGNDACGDDALKDVLDHIFEVRLPDEIIVSEERGIASRAAEYAVSRYIPLRIIPLAANAAEFAKSACAVATHVFSLVTQGKPSYFAQASYDLACETGLIAHQVNLSA